MKQGVSQDSSITCHIALHYILCFLTPAPKAEVIVIACPGGVGGSGGGHKACGCSADQTHAVISIKFSGNVYH